MKNLKLQGLALASLIGLVTAPEALAQYKKTGPDKRSQAQMAEDQCEAQSNGSRQVIVGTLLGGLIGQAIGRDSYVKDCMKARGYEKAKRPRKEPAKRRKDG
ncbi:MAG: hypothetical protein AB7F09_23275 [Parvibaculaceae bacterium]